MYQNELIPGLPNDIGLECLLRVPITSHPTLRLVSHLWKTTLSHPSFFSLRRHTDAAEHLVFLVQPLFPPPPPPPQQQVHQTKEDVQELGVKESDEFSNPLRYNLSVYNSTRHEWRNLVNIAIPTFAQCVAVPAVGKVVVLGGWDPATLIPDTRVIVIDFVSGIWKEGSPMPTARSFFACVAVGSAAVYVAGGHDGRKNALRTAEAYDVEADTWRVLPEMAEERDESHGVVFGSNFWVVSGYGTESQGRFRPDAEIYDPETSTWTRIDGVWPYSGHTPKSTMVAAAPVGQRPRWWCMNGGELKQFDFEDNSWRGLKTGRIPESVNGSTSISLVDIGDNRVMVMGNGEKCGEECKEEMCGGEGVFMVEKSNNNNNNKMEGINWKWEHVHAPSNFLGLPFSSSHLLI
ncbi:hypothetical protein RND81_14G077700 [Saponaria officinalis]